jgi:hypothetical protein
MRISCAGFEYEKSFEVQDRLKITAEDRLNHRFFHRFTTMISHLMRND